MHTSAGKAVCAIGNNDFFAISDQEHKSAKKQRLNFNKVAALVR